MGEQNKNLTYTYTMGADTGPISTISSTNLTTRSVSITTDDWINALNSQPCTSFTISPADIECLQTKPTTISFSDDFVTDIKRINDRVLIVSFKDGTKEKVVLGEGDHYDLHNALAWILLKKAMGGTNKVHNYIDKVIKQQDKRDKKAAEEKTQAEAKKRRHEKRKAKAEAKAAAKREARIQEQAEAYLRAMELAKK